MKSYFQRLLKILNHSLMSLDDDKFTKLIDDCEATLRNGGKIITSGLGKNVPVCEKFVGTMNSLGMASSFMNTNSAAHGDIGMVKDDDLVILLTKSGETAESIYLYHHLVVLLLVFVQIGRDIDGKRCVAVTMLASLLSIDEDLGTLVDAFEVELHQLAIGRLEGLPILTLASRIPSSAGACSSRLGVRSAIDVPVVGQVNTNGLSFSGKLPSKVKECLLLGRHS